MKGVPWSEALDGKELHGAAGNLEPRDSVVSCTSSTWLTRLSPSTSVVLCLFQRGKSLIDSLNCCTVTVAPYMALYFPPRTAVLSFILTRMIHTDSKVCVF